MQNIIQQIAAELRVHASQVQAAVSLLDGGATVPFIARYRKEATGGLDDIQLRGLEQRLARPAAAAGSAPAGTGQYRDSRRLRPAAASGQIM